MRVRNPFRSNSLPQLRTPARNTPDAPRSAPNSPIQPQAPRPPPPKMQLRGNEHPLSQHIGQKAQEQKILDQWNSNAQGRNQGLVHLVDYSYARPPKINTTPPKQGLTPEQMNILKQGDKNGWNEQQWKAKLGDKTFNDLNKQGYFSNFAGANGVPVGANAQKWQQLTGQHQALSGPPLSRCMSGPALEGLARGIWGRSNASPRGGEPRARVFGPPILVAIADWA